MSKTWFITGASRGFGHVWAEAALARGDKVAATARNTDNLKELVEKYGDNILALQLNVDDREADFAAVKQAFDHFGSIDITINNAGYGQFGAVEELSEQEARQQIETNLFGALWITQAVLPYMRKQGHGHILQVSSVGGIDAYAGLGIYNASKWALEALTEALSKEVTSFGIKCTLIEPGGYSTDWAGDSAKHAQPIAAYDGIRDGRPTGKSAAAGDPEATAYAILKVVDSDNPPLRLLLGVYGVEHVKEVYPERLKVWAEWEDVSRAAQGN